VTERRGALALVVLLTLARSLPFVFKASLAFDSDQAIFGLMAKHIAEGRAFPLFMYGTSYILAVEAWLAAPIFLLAGVSVAALKFPLLVMNCSIAALLVTLLERDGGLRPRDALLASMFFVLAPPGTTTELLAPIGGNVEPLLYVILLWLTRRRPALFGLVLGVGFLQREFTIYGLAALVIVEIVTNRIDHLTGMGVADRPHARDSVRHLWSAMRVAAEVWLIAQFLRPFAAAAGPGTTIADLVTPSNNLANLVGRICFDLHSVATGIGRLVTLHWPLLFGTEVVPVGAFLVESSVVQGAAWSGLLLAAAFLLISVRIAMSASAVGREWTRCRFPAYLVLVGAISALVYAAGRCGELAVGTMRYDLLSVLGAVGLVALFLIVEQVKSVRVMATSLVLAWAAISASGHAKVWIEAASRPRVPDKVLIIRNLEARGIRYATADYWIAYYTTFMTNERIIVAADDLGRIPVYEQEVMAHRGEAVRISRAPCGSVRPVIEGVYFCPLE
jgi:hypothetical protein